MNGDLISLEADEIRKAAKIKTHFARIVVGGPVMNPCYSILWYDPSDRDYHIGYSSYSLVNVYDWLRDEFEITSGPFDNEPVRHAKWHLCRISVPGGKGQTYTVWRCSACHKHERKRSDYCPNCGAKMDLKGDNEA